MHRSLAVFTLVLLASAPPAAAATPAALPEATHFGDGDTRYPADCVRRLEAGKALLDRGDLDGAKREFDQAVKLDRSQPMPYFYQAVVAYRQGDYPHALSRAETGRTEALEIITRADDQRTPEMDKTVERFDELITAIKAKNAVQLLNAADEAYAAGLPAKAAAGYAEAFRADPKRGDLGLKAAALYADRLKNPLEAARLWQKVLASGEPHASTARAELQSHRDVLEAVLKAGLAKRDQWRSSLDDTAPLQLAEAFPESAELELELAVIYARKGSGDALTKHLQAASRLGAGADEFLARKEFVEYLQTAGVDSPGGQRLTTFVRDAFGEDTVTALRTELKNRADETARATREKTEQERQRKLAQELRELTTWRNGTRKQIVTDANALIGLRNNLEVELARVVPDKRRTYRNSITRRNSFSFGNGGYHFILWQRSNNTNLGSGTDSPIVNEETIDLPSFATLHNIEVSQSTWSSSPERVGSITGTSYSLPVDQTQRSLCRFIDLHFGSPANITSKRTKTYEYRTYDGTTGYTDTSTSASIISIQAMLTDEEVARLRYLFTTLGAIDQAGDNLEKLRALRR